MKYLKKLAVFFLLISVSQNIIAQQATPKTLLWRISGNGLEQPSFLYGTMHLTDKRLFFFGDSVYSSLESVKGFAMELDPDSMMDSVFNNLFNDDTTSLLVKIIEKEKFDKVSNKLEKKFHMPADKITRRQLIEEREASYYKKHRKDDMKSVVDMYLYNIAHQLGKWVGGIEDVNDQLGIKDELGKDIDIMDYVNEEGNRKEEDYLGKMIDNYVDGDIDGIDKMISGGSKQFRDVLLTNRNIKMARRMDSLAHIRNSFFAVGAAHLPGDSGVIQLLRSRGFTVSPVYSSKKIAPEKYVYKTQEFAWVKVIGADSAYTAEMPGKTTDLKILGDELKMRVYADLVTNIFYMTGFVYNSNTSNDDVYQRMIKAYTTGAFKKIDQKSITQLGFPGQEITSTSESIFYRLRLLYTTDKVFIVITGAQVKENLFVKDVDRFFSSFMINNDAKPKPAGDWSQLNNEQKAFLISFPKKPETNKLKLGQAAGNVESTTYAAMDVSNATYYMLVVTETKKGYLITADSIIFNSKLEAYKENHTTVSDIRYFNQQGQPAMSFTAASQTDGVDLISKTMIVRRGNRTYSMIAVTEKAKEDFPDITKFFRSFSLLDIKPVEWSKRSPVNNLFSTWVPSSIELYTSPEVDTAVSIEDAATAAEENKIVEYQAFDPNAVVTYYMNAYPLGRYFSAKDSNEVLSSHAEEYYTDTASYFARTNPGKFDSLIYKKEVMNGGIKGLEILVSSPANNSLKKVRMFCYGDSIYHLLLITSKEQMSNENNKKFFNDFRFVNEKQASTIFSNKTALILGDLLHKDSATRAQANDALTKAKFTTVDLPLLFEAYLKQYPVDTNEYRTTTQRIGDGLSQVKDIAVVSFIKDKYPGVASTNDELKMDMLLVLAKQRSDISFALIKNLLLTNPPVKGTPYVFFYNLHDSLLLCKQFFPEISKLYTDTVFGSGMVGLTVAMIDSNFLSNDILNKNITPISNIAKKQLQEIKKDKDAYPYDNAEVLEALGKMNTRSCNDILDEYVKLPALYPKQNAVMALLRNDQPVVAAEIKKIAAAIDMRIDFYDSLKTMGKQNLYPKEFATQQKFAESYLYRYLVDDDNDETIILKPVSEKIVQDSTGKKRYYLFKYTSSGEETESESYLAIAGPFDMNKQVITIDYAAFETKIFYEEKYNVSSVDRLFNKFLSEKKQSNKE